jgi:hypothetical protein
MPSYDDTGKIAYAYDADTDTWYAILGKASTAANYNWTGAHGFAGTVVASSTVIASSKFNCFLNPAARSAAITSPSIGLITFIQQNAGGDTVNLFEYWNGTDWASVADPNAATLAGTETLTNKTMSGSNNTFSDIPVASISGLDTVLDGLSDTYASKYVGVNQQTASYVLALSDDGKLVEMGVGSANTLTVPPSSSVDFPIGTTLVIVQTGSGQTTLTAGAGVTINGTPGLKLRVQWSSATLIKRGTDAWIAMGDLSA